MNTFVFTDLQDEIDFLRWHADLCREDARRFYEEAKALREAAHLVLTESNGIGDNEWKRPDGTYTPDFPVDSFCAAIDALEKLIEPLHAKDSSRD